ncbi:VP1 [Stretch Lagoon orbivirus]|uniref:VP1 n=1 Tax=Stretch Lagoon orbivirus TaxID=559180 RepID=UPI0001A51443|nr:VP1 [Stretch Lagoon orbivirus]ACH91290.1 VP1 [Stretch Lagoon orbivirus]
MAVVGHRLTRTRSTLQRIFKGLTIDGNSTYYMYYKYAPRNNVIGSVKSEEEWLRKKDKLYNLPVLQESTWEEIFEEYEFNYELGEKALAIYLDSLIEPEKIEPEEEFLRNYHMRAEDTSDTVEFIRARSREECAVYGDLSLKYWSTLLLELATENKHYPIGLQTLKSLVTQYGAPFRQTHVTCQKYRMRFSPSTIVLLVEMCISEITFRTERIYRMREIEEKHVAIGSHKIELHHLIQELFLVCLPHPKKINNMLRAAYSWYVKTLGTASENITYLSSRGGDDRNSKDVVYTHFVTEKNTYARMLRISRFHRDSKKANIQKVVETIEYANSLLTSTKVDLPIFRALMHSVYTDYFDPRSKQHVVFASYLLSLQVISGYGRAWIKNKGDDEDKIMKPAENNLVSRVCDKTKYFVQKAYDEAKRNGFEIVKPESMYSSLLRLAKNTSSGMSTTVEVTKSFSPKGENREKVKINSRQKAIVIMSEGQKIYSPEYLNKKFNTVESYQTKGSRDVPIKATRVIYAIHVSILAPQLLLTLPLNEYFARHGGPTNPDTNLLSGKVIIGDLEATGSRVMDASDTFRNTGDPTIITFALDYSEYDQHMTLHNFREGMLSGMRSALSCYDTYRYDGHTVNEMIEFGYGEGRIQNTLWSGKRAVMRISKEAYDQLPAIRKEVPDNAPFRATRPGIHLIDNFGGLEPYDGDDVVLVSPWDGSDLAKVSTHLSGENSTLVANSLHNMAIGSVIQEELGKKFGHTLKVLSEMYVGDDTLWYLRFSSSDSGLLDACVDLIFDVVSKVGHEASPAKTTMLPFSAEKTQTHAKCGIYIPQDRMMMVSSERVKNIENIQGYMRSNVMTYVTKVSRGFSEELAHRILLFKSAILGHRKLKRTIKDNTQFRSRTFDSEEDGYTLCIIRDPSILYTPVAWNGYGASPLSLNIVMTPELYLDMLQLPEACEWVKPYSHLIDNHLPPWNETEADTKQIRSNTEMGLFSKLARKAVTASLMDPMLSESVRTLPLQGFGPHKLSHTMMHSALLKEPRARTLLSTGYELEYQKALNGHCGGKAKVDVAGHDLEISTTYAKIFRVDFGEEVAFNKLEYPDRNLSPRFLLQKLIIGNRTSTRMRMSYVDKIDSILRGDVVMRGFITSNHIIRLMEDIGSGYNAEDLTTLFSLMNLDPKVANRLAEYLTQDKTKFDVQRLAKGGVGGDEFTMSLNLMTSEFVDQLVEFPTQLFQAERDALILHASQLAMTLAALGKPLRHMRFVVTEEHKKELRNVRIRSKLPKRSTVKTLVQDIRRLGAGIVEQQFL